MAKDMVFIITLFCFYFFFASIMVFLAQDTTLVDLGLTNDTFSTAAGTNVTFDIHSDEIGGEGLEEHVSLLSLQELSFWKIFLRIITFRIGTISVFPTIMVLVINFINFMALLIGGLLVLRMLRSGAG